MPAWTALREVLRRLCHSRGLDPDIGRRLPMLLRAAGLGEVEATERAGIDEHAPGTTNAPASAGAPELGREESNP